MINYIQGIVKDFGSKRVVVEVNNIGYEINTINDKYKINDDIKLFIQMIIKEDEIILCGFDRQCEKEIFNNLIKISGVGPKIAMNILRFFSVENLVQIIVNEDSQSLRRVSGVNTNLAIQIISGLTNKVSKYSTYENDNDYRNDLAVMEVLQSFSYGKNEIERTLKECKNHSNANDLLKEALVILGRKKNYGK